AEWFYHRLPERVAPFKHYLIGANWSVDRKQGWRGYGFSEIIDPEGKIVAGAHSLYGVGDRVRRDQDRVESLSVLKLGPRGSQPVSRFIGLSLLISHVDRTR